MIKLLIPFVVLTALLYLLALWVKGKSRAEIMRVLLLLGKITLALTAASAILAAVVFIF